MTAELTARPVHHNGLQCPAKRDSSVDADSPDIAELPWIHCPQLRIRRLRVRVLPSALAEVSGYDLRALNVAGRASPFH